MGRVACDDSQIPLLYQSLSVSCQHSAIALVIGDTNGTDDTFVHDRLTHKTERVSIASNGAQGHGKYGSYSPSISADGRYVSFTSDAPNLVAGDTNEAGDIFIHDRLTHKTERISRTLNGIEIKDFIQMSSWESNISADGRSVVFVSDISNLVAKDTNNELDIFVRDRLLDTKHHADLTITPTTKTATLKPNTQGTYLYTISNNGKDIVPDVSLIHLVSGGSAVSFKPSQGTCSPSAVETVCHLGKLAAGKKLTLQVTVKAQSKSVNQQITVSGAPVDNAPNNNHISVTTPVK